MLSMKMKNTENWLRIVELSFEWKKDLKITYVGSTWQQLCDFQVCHGNDPVALATLNQMPLCQYARESSGG